jgi:signal transduction histidine kinase
VRDDGQGFAPVKATAAAPNAEAAVRGFGLKGLAERVQMLGGTHTIDSAPGRGTTVTVRIGTGRSDAGARRGRA